MGEIVGCNRICPQSCREQRPHSRGLFPGLGVGQEKVFPTPGKRPWEQGWENKDTGDSKRNDSPVGRWTGSWAQFLLGTQIFSLSHALVMLISSLFTALQWMVIYMYLLGTIIVHPLNNAMAVASLEEYLYVLDSFFSWNVGPAHIIGISTEVYYFYEYGIEQIVQQYEWLEKDLQVRIRTSDIIVNFWCTHLDFCFQKSGRTLCNAYKL